MKKLLIGNMVLGLLMGAPVAYAEDAHHPEQGGTPAAKSAPEKEVMPSQPAAPDKAMSSGVADAQMVKAQERMKQAQALMAKLRNTKDPAERKKLMHEHTQAMRDTMGMMGGGQGMGMMGGGQGMGMMGGGQGKGPAKAGGMMPMHQMMEDRMEMMQMMMEQMFERQEMLMRDGK